MSEQVKACPFCGGDVQFHKDEGCDGCHYIQCGQCWAFFDFAAGADPENNCESVDALRAAIVPMWNRRAQDFDTLAQRLQEAESLRDRMSSLLRSIRRHNSSGLTRDTQEEIDALLAGKGGKA